MGGRKTTWALGPVGTLGSSTSIAQIIQDFRYLVITPETITTWSYVGEGNVIIKFIPIIIVVALLVLGSWYFRRKSKRFAEEI